MRRILGTMMAATALLAATPAAAQLSVDFKVGYGVPAGGVMQGVAQSTVMSGSLPLELAARWRFDPRLSAGVYYQYSGLFFQSGSCGERSCTGWDMRAGIEGVWSMRPGETLSPWLSLGTGWQWTQFRGGSGTTTGTLAFNGWEIFNLQVGLDVFVAKEFVFGPYVGFFGGIYTAEKLTLDLPVDSGSESVSIPSSDRAFHGWWQFGLKGTFNL